MFSTDNKPSIFVSAVSADLRSTRELICKGLNSLGCLPVEQERFDTAAYQQVVELLRSKISDCQGVIHVVGLRYGRAPDPSTVPAHTPQRSYTQLEFEIARELKKDVYVFVCDDKYPYDGPRPGTDPETEPAEVAELQLRHREQLTAPGSGAYNRVATDTELRDQVAKLHTRINALRRQLQRIRLVAAGGIAAVVLVGTALAAMSFRLDDRVRTLSDDFTGRSEMFLQETNDLKALLQRMHSAQQEMVATRTSEVPVSGSPLASLSDNAYFEELAKRMNVSIPLLKRTLEQLRQSEDLETQAGAALAARRFDDAIRVASESQVADRQKLRKIREEAGQNEQELHIRIARAAFTEARAAFHLEKYDLALEKLQVVKGHVQEIPPDKQPKGILGELHVVLAQVQLGRSNSLEGAELVAAIEASVAANRAALELALPASPTHAVVLNNLGHSLVELARISKRPIPLIIEAKNILESAISAYDELIGRNAELQEWIRTERATAQDNLGMALVKEADNVDGERRRQLLNLAMKAFEAVLTVRTRDRDPNAWAWTQINVALTTENVARISTATQREEAFLEAVEKYTDVANAIDRENHPRLWSTALMGLGSVYSDMAEGKQPDEKAVLLRKSLHAYNETLTVTKRRTDPVGWAACQLNIGHAFRLKSETQSGPAAEADLRSSIAALREALLILTPDSTPESWTIAKDHLALALVSLSQLTAGDERDKCITEAIDVYRTLVELTWLSEYPDSLASAYLRYGIALNEQAKISEQTQKSQLLADSSDAFGKAQKIYTRTGHPNNWAATHYNLGLVREQQAKLADSVLVKLDFLAIAASHYENALEVYNVKNLPAHFSEAHSALGGVRMDQASDTIGASRIGFLNQAIEGYNLCIQVSIEHLSKAQLVKAHYNLGLCYWTKAQEDNSEHSFELLTRAVREYEQALAFVDKGASADLWASIHQNMAAAYESQAWLREGAEQIKLLRQSLQFSTIALETYQKDADSTDWAKLQFTRGLTLTQLANLTSGAERITNSHKAIEAYKNAIEGLDEGNHADQMSRVKLELANAYSGLANLQTGATKAASLSAAVPLYAEVAKYFDDSSVAATVAFIYLEELFDTETAYQYLADWTAAHPSDLGNQLNLCEVLFLTERFDKCVSSVLSLREACVTSDDPVREGSRAALEILVFTAIDKPTEIDHMIRFVKAQEPAFKLGWTTTALEKFLRTSDNSQIRKNRERLLLIADALSQSDRDSLLAKLEELHNSAPPSQ